MAMPKQLSHTANFAKKLDLPALFSLCDPKEPVPIREFKQYIGFDSIK